MQFLTPTALHQKRTCTRSNDVYILNIRRLAAISFVPMNTFQEMPAHAVADSSTGTTCVGTLENKEAQRKAKNRVDAAKWRANNKAKIKAKNAKYYESNSAKSKAYSANYRATHGTTDKVKQRAYSAKYNANNRDKRKAKKAEYYASNRDKEKAKSAAWRANNGAKLKDYEAKRYADPEIRAMLKARKAKYRAKNRDKVNAQSARYHANNRDKIMARKAKRRVTPHGRVIDKASAHIRRARKLSVAIGDPRVISDWLKKWRTEQVVCYWCRAHVAGEDAHVDHIQPLARGGAHRIDNLCISCQPCNSRKHAKGVDEWNKKLLEPVLL